MNHSERSKSLAALVLLVALSAACNRNVQTTGSGGGGGGGGGGANSPYNPGMNAPPPAVLEGDWGPIPTAVRTPGTIAPPSYRPILHVHNLTGERTETVQASVPFPWGMVTDLQNWSIEGRDTAWLVLQRWPDRSIRIAQAQWTETMAATSSLLVRAVPSPSPAPTAFTPHPVFAAGLPAIGLEVQDTFGVPYRTFFAAPGESLQETRMVRTRKFRGYLLAQPGTGIGRDYLTATFYVTEFRDQPTLLVDCLVGNDYLGLDVPNGSADRNLYPLGSVDVTKASFLVGGVDTALPYRAFHDEIAAPFTTTDGLTAFELMRNTYIGDGQMRRYRFVLGRDDALASAAANAAARATQAAIATEPLRPIATAETWRATHALGLLGGPQSAPSDVATRVTVDIRTWSSQPQFFGTWGNHGDPVATGQTGTPRNNTVTPELLHAAQTGDPGFLLMLEQKAWTQALRPYHLSGLRVGIDNRVFLWDGVPMYPGGRDLSFESLGRRALTRSDRYAAYRTRVPPTAVERAHGFEHFDVEHWSTDLLFDHWSVTGDAWTRDELRQMGECLRGLVRPSYYVTATMLPARAEGWVLQSLVQIYLATEDLRFRNFALDRLHNIIDRDRNRTHPSFALRLERDEVRTGFPMPHQFYMPWQHSAALYGFLGAWKFFGDPLCLELAQNIVRCVDYGWVRNYQDPNPNLGLVANGLRYYVPASYNNQIIPPSQFDSTVGVLWGDGPLGGAHQELLSGLFLLASMPEVTDTWIRDRATEYATQLLRLPLSDDDYWDKWFVNMPAQYYR